MDQNIDQSLWDFITTLTEDKIDNALKGLKVKKNDYAASNLRDKQVMLYQRSLQEKENLKHLTKAKYSGHWNTASAFLNLTTSSLLSAVFCYLLISRPAFQSSCRDDQCYVWENEENGKDYLQVRQIIVREYTSLHVMFQLAGFILGAKALQRLRKLAYVLSPSSAKEIIKRHLKHQKHEVACSLFPYRVTCNLANVLFGCKWDSLERRCTKKKIKVLKSKVEFPQTTSRKSPSSSHPKVKFPQTPSRKSPLSSHSKRN